MTPFFAHHIVSMGQRVEFFNWQFLVSTPSWEFQAAANDLDLIEFICIYIYIWVLHNKSQFSTNTSGQVSGWIVSLTWISRNCCGFPYYLLPFQERKLVMWCCDEHWFTQLDFGSKKSDKENAATEIDSSEMEFPRFWYVGKCPPPPKKKVIHHFPSAIVEKRWLFRFAFF